MDQQPNEARKWDLKAAFTGFVWNQYKIGIDKPCVYTGPTRSVLDRFSYPVPNGFTCERDSVWNCAVP